MLRSKQKGLRFTKGARARQAGRPKAREAVPEPAPPRPPHPDQPEQSPGPRGRIAPGRDAPGRPRRGTAMTPAFVGIDVSKDHLDIHLRPAGEAFRLPNDPAGVAALAA